MTRIHCIINSSISEEPCKPNRLIQDVGAHGIRGKSYLAPDALFSLRIRLVGGLGLSDTSVALPQLCQIKGALSRRFLCVLVKTA